MGFGILSDCVFGSTSAPSAGPALTEPAATLTTGWQVNASYEHYWTPQFHEFFIFGFEECSYNSQANAILCAAEGAGVGSGTGSFPSPGQVVTTTSSSGRRVHPPPVRLHQDPLYRRGVPVLAPNFGEAAWQCLNVGSLGATPE